MKFFKFHGLKEKTKTIYNNWTPQTKKPIYLYFGSIDTNINTYFSL